MNDTLSPQQKLPKLIVVMAFQRDEKSELQAAFDAQDFPTEDRAVRTARSLTETHAGVIAWSREANVDVGEYGPPTVLFQAGDGPDME